MASPAFSFKAVPQVIVFPETVGALFAILANDSFERQGQFDMEKLYAGGIISTVIKL